jgi:hypothetical protein
MRSSAPKNARDDQRQQINKADAQLERLIERDPTRHNRSWNSS